MRRVIVPFSLTMTRTLLAFILALGQAGSSALEGRWTADLSASKVHPGVSVRSIALTFVVSPDRVHITDDVVLVSGQQVGQGGAEFLTDGEEHPNDALLTGLVVRASWISPHRLE